MSQIDGLRIYTVFELEQLAEQQLACLGIDHTIPVDIEFIIEKHPELTLDLYPKLAMNHKTEGMVGPDDKTGEMVIYIDEDLYDCEARQRRCRMTIAEEYAHFLLQRPLVDRATSPQRFLEIQRMPGWYQYERNAKRLAAALLMPGKQVLKGTRNWYEKIAEEFLTRSVELSAEVIIPYLASKLADQYDVSVQTMNYRLKEWPIKATEKICEACREQLSYLR